MRARRAGIVVVIWSSLFGSGCDPDSGRTRGDDPSSAADGGGKSDADTDACTSALNDLQGCYDLYDVHVAPKKRPAGFDVLGDMLEAADCEALTNTVALGDCTDVILALSEPDGTKQLADTSDVATYLKCIEQPSSSATASTCVELVVRAPAPPDECSSPGLVLSCEPPADQEAPEGEEEPEDEGASEDEDAPEDAE